MHSVPGGLEAQPPVGSRGEFFPHFALIEARRAIQNRFITKLISVRLRGFALGRGSLLGIAVAVLTLKVRRYARNSRHQTSDVKSTVECLS